MVLLVLVLAFNLFPMGAMVGGSSGPPIDLRLFYTPDVVQAQADAIAARGDVAGHVRTYLLLDTPYPLLYTAFLVFALTWALQRGPHARHGTRLSRVVLLPLGALVFDNAENLGMVATLLAHPEPLPLLAWCMSAFTALKWLFVLLSVAALLALLVAAAAQQVKARASRA